MPEEKEPEPEEEAKDIEPTRYKVTVTSRRTIDVPRVVGEPEKQLVITYTAAGMAPATIFIMKDEYSLDLEKSMIRKAVEKKLEEQIESYEV